ncbi:Crp/Fnr family transcriptional regulator [Chloroflexota bacterium]
MAVQIEYLKSIPYFSGLSPDELDSIKQFIFEKTAERGELILFEGNSSDTLFLVISGVVKVFKTSTEGKEQILNLAHFGDTLNDVPIFDDGPNPASIQAMGPIVLYGLRKSKLKIILQEYPKISLNIIKILAARMRRLVSLVEDLSFRHVISRVARILLEHAGDGTMTNPRLTQHEMAAMAGTVREVVARSLRTLEDEGTIKLQHHRIVITNKEALKEIMEASS